MNFTGSSIRNSLVLVCMQYQIKFKVEARYLQIVLIIDRDRPMMGISSVDIIVYIL